MWRRTVAPPANRIVIVEGIYALSDRLRPSLDLRVSIRGGVHLDLARTPSPHIPSQHPYHSTPPCASCSEGVAGLFRATFAACGRR